MQVDSIVCLAIPVNFIPVWFGSLTFPESEVRAHGNRARTRANISANGDKVLIIYTIIIIIIDVGTVVMMIMMIITLGTLQLRVVGFYCCSLLPDPGCSPWVRVSTWNSACSSMRVCARIVIH